jgi:acetyltransferase-like isoleucine patch superfamily enzyme
MFKNNFILNPKRGSDAHGFKAKIKHLIQLPLIRLLQWLGFLNIDYTYIHGDKSSISIGENCSTMNAIMNVISGKISIGDNTILGHNCMLLTGTHIFYGGKLGSLCDPIQEETPKSGRDIEVGAGCFIGSGSTILGPVKIGNNVLVAAGSIVNTDLPDSCVAAGVPAKIIKMHEQI